MPKKANAFLITGSPRCRAAWLSVLCSTANARCYYNPSYGFTDLSDLERLYESDHYKFVGAADSVLALFLPQILDTIKPRTLIVYREPEKRTRYTKQAFEAMEAVKNHPLVLCAPFEALAHKRVIQKLFWHLLPGEAFDEERYAQLEKMRITADPEWAAAEYVKCRPQLERFIRTAQWQAETA
jgi:hypothetical protein